MKPWKSGMLALVAATSIVACAADNDADNRASGANPPATPGAQGATGTSGTAGDVDRDFIRWMLSDGQAEIALGQLAQQRGSNAQLKEFGEMLARDHQKAGAELKQIVSSLNVQVDTAMDDEHADARERLSKLSGAEFDREWIDVIVENHEEAVDKARDKAEEANAHAELKAWASKQLPALQQHLQQAQKLQETLKR